MLPILRMQPVFCKLPLAEYTGKVSTQNLFGDRE